MKILFASIQTLFKKNFEVWLLVLLIIVSGVGTQVYNLNKKEIGNNYFKLINNSYFQQSLGHVFENLEPKLKNIEYKIKQGDTFAKVMKNHNVPNNEIAKINKILANDKNFKNLRVNQKIIFTLDKSKENRIVKYVYPATRTLKIELIRDITTDEFKKREIVTNLNRKIIFKEGKITQSLYRTASNLKVQPNVIVDFARIYGFQVDFQRDIRKNDSFQILYEIYVDDRGKIFETGNIIFSNLNLRGQNNSLYYYDQKDSQGHYDKNGKSAKKALMKTPINGARLSSPFGMRKHPIDGFNKMHRGTDFAAPEGTPIMASGDGIVTRAKWCGGGGNCIKIKHNSTYQTIYAHMSKFAHGMRPGVRVKQGQIIGYVGSTGKSTGPHLHYEVIENGRKINSQTLKLPSGKILSGKNREKFEIARIKTDVLISEVILGLN